MRFWNLIFILGLVLVFWSAQRLEAQVAGNPTLRTLDISRLRAPRGSSALTHFRRFSSGADRFSRNITRTQPDPLALNNMARMGVLSGPTPGTAGFGMASRPLSRGMGNRVSTYIGETRLYNRANRTTTFQPRSLSNTRGGVNMGTGFYGGTGLNAGAGFNTGAGLNLRNRLGGGNRALSQSQRFSAAALSRRRPAAVAPIGSSLGFDSLSQGSLLLRRNSILSSGKTQLSERKTYTEQDPFQQRMKRSIFGGATTNLFGRINRFSP